MESRPPQASPGEALASKSPPSTASRGAGARGRPPAGQPLPGQEATRGAQPGAGDDKAAASRLVSLRLQSGAGGDGSNSIVITAVRQLEQRLESERRHTERQLQRLERQVEELINVPPSGGRWAELQGHVDGLAETVQTLVRRGEEPSLGARGPAQGASNAAASSCDTTVLTSLGMRLGSLETWQAKTDKRMESTQDSFMKLQDEQSRHQHEFKEQLDNVFVQLQLQGSLQGFPQPQAPQALAACEQKLRALQDHVDAISARVEGSERAALSRRTQPASALLACSNGDSKDDVSSEGYGSNAFPVDGRAEAGRYGLADASGSDDESAPELLMGSRDRSEAVEAVEEQVAGVCEHVDDLHAQLDEQLSMLHERLADLELRVQDTEGNFQDLQVDQDVRQETTHVSEQVLRLAVRMQRVERGGAGSGMAVDPEEVRELRDELGHFSEQLLQLAGRLSSSERGLTGMAEAFSRVCEELAQLRGGPGRPSPVRSSVESSREQVEAQGSPAHVNSQNTTRSSELEASQQVSPGARSKDDMEPAPLQHKVGEMEKSLESMAEVVWELRKQVASLRSNFGTLQTTVLGEAAPGDD